MHPLTIPFHCNCLHSLSLLIFCLVYHASCVSAQLPTPTQTPSPQVTQLVDLTKKYRTWNTRIFSVNTTSPVTNYFRTHPSEQQLLTPAFDYIDAVWSAVKKRRDGNDSRACNLYDINGKTWATKFRTRIEIFQIGIIDRTCFSQINVVEAMIDGEISRKIGLNVRRTFEKAHESFARAFERLRIRPDSNWSVDGQPYNMSYRVQLRSSQTCYISSLLAHRNNSIWYLRGATTNAPISISQPSFHRHYLQEFIPRNGTVALQMPFPNVNTGNMERGTTLVAKWGGTGYSIEEDNFDDPISPLSKAYRNNLVAVDLSSDAITVSNIAILALPMVMNFIPIAFVTDIHSSGMLIYIIVTDVFSSIPFLIKGFELIQSSQPRNEEVYAFFSGNETLGTMQSWVVECTGNEHFRVVGVCFVVFGFIVIVAGIIMEIWAKKYMDRRRAATKDPRLLAGPFGKVQLNFHFRFRKQLKNNKRLRSIVST